ncbi:MAG TPA: response regulator [Candidatus Dormibacteraeota bacterium]|nr:response regulator [Candidatus Dormibacteraeota bacterium]
MARVTDPEESQARPAPASKNGKKIFIAEDDPFISRMYNTKLSSAGYEVSTASNGRDAFEKIKVIRPHLVMIDLNMPELSGFEVLTALKGSGFDFKATKVVILTNSAQPGDQQKAQALGFDYLIKADLTPRNVLDYINSKLGVKQ